MSRSRAIQAWWWVAILTVLALALRAWNLDYGLPGVFNMDERPILDRALTFAKGDPNPRNFLYPTLHLYLLFAWEGMYFVVGRLLGWFGSLAEFQNAFFVDPSGHVLAGRALTALFGAATVPAVYLLGRRLYGPAVGVGAALVMAVAPMAVRDAHYIKLDVPVTFFTALAHAALAVLVTDPDRASRRRHWIVAGVFAGLAISTQYYAAFLAVPFVAVAVADVRRSGRWQASLALLLWAGAATLAGFVAGSPFFVTDVSVILRDFTELREVDIDRAVGAGLFSSTVPYARLLVASIGGWLPASLGAIGVCVAFAADWRRAVVLASFGIAFFAFCANTFPASRYLNIMLPCLAVAVAYGAAQVVRVIVRRDSFGPVVLASAIAALPAAVDSARWNRFFGQDDTRTLAAAFIVREIPSGATILVQPYSAPLRQSKEGLREALTARLGDPSKAPLKHRLMLAAEPYPSPAYRLLYVGEGGKTGLTPGDPDKLYLSPRSFPDRGVEPLRESGVQYVILTRYGPTPASLAPLHEVLQARATLVRRFSPYKDGSDGHAGAAPPFRHNGNTWLDEVLDRPGPIVELWRVP